MQITGPLPEKIASDDEQALFKRLFVASPDAIVVTAGDGRISAVIRRRNGFSATHRQS